MLRQPVSPKMGQKGQLLLHMADCLYCAAGIEAAGNERARQEFYIFFLLLGCVIL